MTGPDNTNQVKSYRHVWVKVSLTALILVKGDLDLSIIGFPEQQ